MLRFLLPVLFVTGLPALTAAQYGTGMQELMGNKQTFMRSDCNQIYAGFSTGLNGPTGVFGPQADIVVTPRISAAAGVGISSWGAKVGLEGRFYFSPCNRGFALGAGATYNTGNKSRYVPDVKTRAGNETILIKQDPVYNIMVSAYYFVSLGPTPHRFHIQLGYSLPFGDAQDPLQRLSGEPLEPDVRQPFPMYRPGGPIVAAGLSFGFSPFRRSRQSY